MNLSTRLLTVSFCCILCLAAGLAKEPAKSSAARIPTGAKTPRAAAEIFFKAYQAHDGKTAAEVAADGPVKELLATRGAGQNPSLELIDDMHIYVSDRRSAS